MFGLMRSRACALGPDERLRRRLHYCGTCKSAGRLYGQRARMLLNFDTVFAAELLNSLARVDPLDGWDAAFESHNCFRLPDAESIPPALRYAAAMTVVLAELKLADRIADSGHRRWRLVRRSLSPSFRRAAADLARVGFPVAELRRIVGAQEAIEARLLHGPVRSPASALDEAAGPTARATALAFGQGAAVAGTPAAAETLGELGHAFGELVYLVDALEDYERDARSGDFNAIRAAYGLAAGPLPIDVRGEVAQRMRGLAGRVETALGRLPIPPERAALFADRLRANVGRRASARGLPVLRVQTAATCRSVTLAARRAAAASLARSATQRHLVACRPLPLRWAEAPVVFGVAAVAGFVAPHLAAASPSLRECLDATLNVAALGSALAAMAVPPPLPPGPIDPTRPRGRHAAQATGDGSAGGDASGWCDCCDCIDCADCCGSSHSCCCCDCDSASGCECCCSGGDCCGSCDCAGCCDC